MRPTTGPAVRTRSRLVGIDATRGVALLGMMAVHVLPDEDPDGTISLAYQLASGRAAATFAVLAGVGLALWSARATRADADPMWDPRGPSLGVKLVLRAVAIGTIGLLLGVVDSGLAVILPYYALLFLLAVPLLRQRSRVLVGLAVVAALVVPVLSHAIRPGLPAPSGQNITVGRLVGTPIQVLAELVFTGYYPALAWLTYLCAGLVIGRLRLASTRVALGLLIGGAVLAVATSVVSWLLLDVCGGRERIAATFPPGTLAAEARRRLSDSQYGATPTSTWWWLAVDAPHSSTPPDLIHTTGSAVALLGLMLLLVTMARRVSRPLAAAGRMTLTLYCAHVLVVRSPLLPEDPVSSYVLQVMVALLVATTWSFSRRRGLLEALVGDISLSRSPAVPSG